MNELLKNSDILTKDEKIICLYFAHLNSEYESLIYTTLEAVSNHIMIPEERVLDAVMSLEEKDILLVDHQFALMGFLLDQQFLIEYLRENGKITYC